MDSPCSLEALHSNTRMSSCALPLGYMAARTLRHSNLSGQARPVLGPGMLMPATGSVVINHFWREISRDAPSQFIQAEPDSRHGLIQALDLSWQAIVGNGGQASECGWCIDRWGLRWQIIPRVLTNAIAAGGETAQRAFAATQTMQKIDIATIEAAAAGR